jgi:uncharacterized Zn-binding protein involved in type VI secretion
MPLIQRIGDKNDAGGEITDSIATQVRVNNIPVSVDGSPVSSHGKDTHLAAKTQGGSARVRAQNQPINFEGNADTCGHLRVGGSVTVRVGV